METVARAAFYQEMDISILSWPSYKDHVCYVDNKALRKSVSYHKSKCTVLLFIVIASIRNIRYLAPDRKELRQGDYVRLQNNMMKSWAVHRIVCAHSYVIIIVLKHAIIIRQVF